MWHRVWHNGHTCRVFPGRLRPNLHVKSAPDLGSLIPSSLGVKRPGVQISPARRYDQGKHLLFPLDRESRVARRVAHATENVLNLPACHAPRRARAPPVAPRKVPGITPHPRRRIARRSERRERIRTAGASCGSCPTRRAPSGRSARSAGSSTTSSPSTRPRASPGSAAGTPTIGSRLGRAPSYVAELGRKVRASRLDRAREPSGRRRHRRGSRRLYARLDRDGLGASGIRHWHALISGALSAGVRWGELTGTSPYQASSPRPSPGRPAPPRARARPPLSRRRRESRRPDARRLLAPRRLHRRPPGRALRPPLDRSRRRPPHALDRAEPHEPQRSPLRRRADEKRPAPRDRAIRREPRRARRSPGPARDALRARRRRARSRRVHLRPRCVLRRLDAVSPRLREPPLSGDRRRRRAPSSVCHPHGFRHYFASQGIAAGADVAAMAAVLGHDPTLLLSTYTHAVDDARIAAVASVGKTLAR